MFNGHKSLQLFHLDYLKNCLYSTNPHTVQDLQVEIEAVAQEITGGRLHYTGDSFLVHSR
jgi:hypothetical protein